MQFERTDLDNGIRILTERMPEVRSATFGAWVGAGSRDEQPELSGATCSSNPSSSRFHQLAWA